MTEDGYFGHFVPNNFWAEYDSAAEWCAARGLKGKIGDRLPANISPGVLSEIYNDPEAFEDRVRDCAYARAMESHTKANDE